jgi:hypothetical protein
LQDGISEPGESSVHRWPSMRLVVVNSRPPCPAGFRKHC